MPNATHSGITIINFGMAVQMLQPLWTCLLLFRPKRAFLGKCGGLRTDKNAVGDLILPIAVFGEKVLRTTIFPAEVPALPAFALQKAISTTIRDYAQDY